LGVGEGGPVRLLVAEAADVLGEDLLDRHANELGRALMPGNTHATSPLATWTLGNLPAGRPETAAIRPPSGGRRGACTGPRPHSPWSPGGRGRASPGNRPGRGCRSGSRGSRRPGTRCIPRGRAAW